MLMETNGVVEKLLYCSFCGLNQKEVKKLIAGPSVFICDKCVEMTVDIIEDSIGEIRVRRTIEFKPEQTQAGLSILSYFSKVFNQKYPDASVTVKIEQNQNSVSMEVKTPEGYVDRVEQTLDQYGLVVLGQIPPEKFLSDPIHALELKNKLELSSLELRMTKELHHNISTLQTERIRSLEVQVSQLHALVGSGISQSSDLHSLLKALIRSTSRDSQVDRAIGVLIESIARGVYSESDKKANDAITTIATKDPKLLKHIQDIAKGAIGGATGDLASSWILAFINALPK